MVDDEPASTNSVIIKTDNDYTIIFVRIVVLIASGIIFLSIKYAVYNVNQDDHAIFNDALANDLGLKIAISCGLFTAAPLVLDLILDFRAPVSLQFLLSERVTFLLSLLLGTLPLKLFSSANNISQIYIASEAVRDLLVMYTCGAGLYKVNPEVFTSFRISVLCFLMSSIWCVDVYDANAPLSRKEEPEFLLRETIIYSVLYFVYFCYIMILLISTRKLYQTYIRNVSDNITPSLSTANLLNIILMYGLLGLFLPIFIYNNFIKEKGNMSTRNGQDLTFRTYVHLLLMIIMVIFPARLLRHEMVHVRSSINTKKSIARHVYREIRIPLNIVVMGLDLLSSTLPIRANLETDVSEDQVIPYIKPEFCKLSRIRSGIELDAHPHVQDVVKLSTLRKDSLKLLDSIIVACNNVVNIVNEMLTVASLEDGVGMKRKRYSVGEFIQHIMEPFKLHAKQKRINLKYSNRIVSKKTALYNVINCVNIDAIKVGQVFRNFMSNALLYTPEKGSISVVIKGIASDSLKNKNKFLKDNAVGRYKRSRETKRLRKKRVKSVDGEDSYATYNQDLRENSHSPVNSMGSQSFWDSDVLSSVNVEYLDSIGNPAFVTNKETPSVRVSVTDTGKGVSSGDIKKLFHAVLQTEDNVELQGNGGSGFGLKIAKGVIEQHGGRVGVSSNGIGKGSTFFLELPLYSLYDTGVVTVAPDGLCHIGNRPPDGSSKRTELNPGANGDRSQSDQNNVVPTVSLALGNANTDDADLEANSGGIVEDLSNDDVKSGHNLSHILTNSRSLDNSNEFSGSAECSYNSTPASSLSRQHPAVAIQKHRGKLQIKRVLVVDGSSVSRRIIRKILTNMDSKLIIDEASSGQACIDVVLEKYGKLHDIAYYDVVIIDNGLTNGKSGYDTVRSLRTDLDGGFINPFADSMCFTGLIIGISALADDSDIKKFKDSGADVVLTKPVDTRRLVSILREYKET